MPNFIVNFQVKFIDLDFNLNTHSLNYIVYWIMFINACKTIVYIVCKTYIM